MDELTMKYINWYNYVRPHSYNNYLTPMEARYRQVFIKQSVTKKLDHNKLQLAGYEFSDLTVLRIEQGTRFVPDYEVVALAEFFHVSCEYLLGVKKEK